MILRRKILIILSATFINLNSSFAASSYDPTNDLITAYCSGSVGEHSRNALAQAEALKDTVERIKNDAACSDVYAASMNLYENLSKLGSLYENNKNSQEFKVNRFFDEMEIERSRLMDSHIASYLSAHPGATPQELAAERLSYSPTSPLLTSLEETYAQEKINLISTTITLDGPQQKNEQDYRIQKIAAIKSGVENLFSSLKSSTECSRNYGNLLSQMGAQVLGTAGSIYSGIIGSSLLAGSVFISGTSELITQIKYKTKLDELKNTRLQLALGCSLEGIAKTYCEARNTQTVLNNILKFDPSVAEQNVFKGISLLTKEIIPFNKWVQRIVAGSNPTTTSQADDRIKAFDLRNTLESFKQGLMGGINETANTINNLTGSTDVITAKKNTLIITLMGDIAATISPIQHSSSSGGGAKVTPYSNAFANDKECGAYVYIYSVGRERVKGPNPQGNPESCQDYLRRAFADTWINPPSTDTIRMIVDNLNAEATEYVSLRLNQVLEENPRLVMALYESEDPRTLTTPHEFLDGITLYLNKFRSELRSRENGKLIRLIEKTEIQINNAVEIINSDVPEDLQLSRLGILLAPNQLTFSINNALREIVKQDVDMKLKNKKISNDDLQFLLKITPTNSVDLFTKYYLNIQMAQDDAALAKNMTKKNLEVFGSLFSENYLKNLAALQKDWENNHSEDVRRQIGLNCVQALIVPDESRLHGKKLDKLCAQVFYPSSNSQVPNLNYDELKNKNFDSRVCRIYDFKKKLQLLELLK